MLFYVEDLEVSFTSADRDLSSANNFYQFQMWSHITWIHARPKVFSSFVASWDLLQILDRHVGIHEFFFAVFQASRYL